MSAGVWICYHSDWSGFVLFVNEIEALRHAVRENMDVGFAHFGTILGGGRFPVAHPNDPPADPTAFDGAE